MSMSYMYLEYVCSCNPRRKAEGEHIWRNNDKNLPEFNENHVILSEAQWVPKKNKYKETTHRSLIVKILKTKDKNKILKVAREKWHIAYREVMVWLWLTSHCKQQRSEDNGMTYLKPWREVIVNPEFYIQQKYPSEWRGM